MTLTSKEKEILELALRLVSDDYVLLETFSDMIGEDVSAVEVENLNDKLTLGVTQWTYQRPEHIKAS